MHKFSISKRYGRLFEVVITEANHYSENMVFPQFGIPLIFRTDASARLIARQINDFFNEGESQDNIASLAIDGIVIANLPLQVIEKILSTWNNQAIYLGDIEVKQPICNDTFNNDACEWLLKRIYSQAVSIT